MHVSRGRTGREYAFRAVGARTLTLEIDRRRHLPVAYDMLDGHGRIALCDDLDWTVHALAPRAIGASPRRRGRVSLAPR